MPYTTQLLRAQVARGDFFFCASERQRDYWIGMLAGAGRVTSAAYRADPDLRQLDRRRPVRHPRRAAAAHRARRARRRRRASAHDDPLLIWNGGLWGWFEPELFIRAIDVARARGAERPRATSWASAIPAPKGSRARRESAIALAERLGLRDTHVFFNDWTPYDTRQNVYLDATAAVSFHRAHLETRFSFRTRILDCIWASLPIVCSEGDVLADLVRNEQLGITVPSGDVDAAAAAIVRIATDDALQRERARQPRPRSRTATPGATALAAARRPGSRSPSRSGPRDESRRVRARRAHRPAAGIVRRSHVPLPLRKHVLGPAKRALQRAAVRLGRQLSRA